MAPAPPATYEGKLWRKGFLARLMRALLNWHRGNMMQNVLIATGHGYENHPAFGRCTVFDGYEVLANPLGGYDNAARESRVFNRKENGNGGICYGAFSIKLAKREFGRELYILMEHGGGREVWQITQFFDGGGLAAHILAMPERLQYSLLFTIWKTASESRNQGQDETRAKWAQAYVDGKIKKRRATKIRGARVEIVV